MLPNVQSAGYPLYMCFCHRGRSVTKDDVNMHAAPANAGGKTSNMPARLCVQQFFTSILSKSLVPKAGPLSSPPVGRYATRPTNRLNGSETRPGRNIW